MRSRTLVVVTVVVTLVATTLVGHILSQLGVGPYWVHYHSESGIEYACMYESKQAYIDVTYEQTHERYTP